MCVCVYVCVYVMLVAEGGKGPGVGDSSTEMVQLG